MDSLQFKNDHRQNAMIHVFNNGYTVSLLLFLAGSIGSFCDATVSSRTLGVAELAAVGLIYPYDKFMECISLIFSAGSQVVISRKIGKSRFDEVSSVFFTSLIALGVAGIVLSVLVIAAAQPLSVFFGASSSGNTLSPTVTYLRSLAVGAPAYLLTLYLIPLYQLDGKKHIINIATAAMTVSNVVLNLSFVYLGYGIAGIGYSTSISYYISLLILSVHFFEKKKGILLQGKFRTDVSCLSTIIKDGLPAAFKNITSIIYNLFLNNLISRIGSTGALAAFSAFKSTKFIFLSVTEAIINPVRMIQSMLYEEKDIKTLRAIFKHAVSIALILSLGFALFIWAFGRQMYSFIVSGDVLDETVLLMNYAAVLFILNTFVCYYLAYFQAINKKRIVYSIPIVLNIVSIPYTYLLGQAFGTEGIWMSLVIQVLTTSVYVIVCALYLGRKNTLVIDKLLALPREKEAYEVYDYHIATNEDAAAGMEIFSNLCKNRISSNKDHYYLCLAFEEIVFNILEYEREHGKDLSSIDVHILISDSGKMLVRIKDLSREYNPFEMFEYSPMTDDMENLGIRMVKTFAEDVQYSYIYNINFITITI